MSGGLRIDPSGETVTVSITTAGAGAPLTLYTDPNFTVPFTNPSAITTATTVFTPATVDARVSLKIGGVEYATQSGATLAYTFSDGGVGSAAPIARTDLDQTAADNATYLQPRARAADDTSLTAKAAGNGLSGIVDWTNDDTTGYLFHLHAGANSSTNAACIGIGTDLGHGGGILVAHKNDNYGIKIDCHPGSAIGEYIIGYGAGQPLWIDQYAGSGAITHRARTGQGYNDGVTTQGSTTFTSATAAFTGADVGVALTQLTSTGGTDLLGSIPAGTTIASVTNGTTVVMSAAAGYSSTGIKFLVAGRAMGASQVLEKWLDTDGSTVLAQMARGSATWNIPAVFLTNDVAQPAVKATGKASQSADILQVFISGSGTPALSVASTGRVVNAYGMYQSNAGLTTQSVAFFQHFATSASVPAVAIKGVSGQNGQQLDIQDSTGAMQSRFDKAGRFVTTVAAPVLGDLADGQMAVGTDASGNLIVTSRVGGVLKSATVTVS